MAKQVGDSSLFDTWADNGLIVKPPVENFGTGWRHGEQPPREWMNWLQNTFGQKINHVLRNGVPEWHVQNVYITDDFTKRGGKLWKAVQGNVGNDPALDDGTNWVEFSPGGQSAFRGCLLIKSSDQALPNGTVTSANAVTFDAELYDTDNFFDSATSTTRITIPSGINFARFTGHGAIVEDTAGADWVTLWLVKNGVADGIGSDPGGMFRELDMPVDAGFRILGAQSAVLPVSAGDFFELYAFITGSTGVIEGSADTHRTWFSMEVVG